MTAIIADTIENNRQKVIDILKSDGAFETLITLLNNPRTTPSLKKQCAMGLVELEDNRAVLPLINQCLKAGKNRNGTFIYVLSFFNCTGHVKELIKLGFESSYEARTHICDILNKIDEIDPQEKQMLLETLKIRKSLLMNQKIVHFEDMEFIENCIYLIGEMSDTVLAKVIPFRPRVINLPFQPAIV